MSYVEKHVTNVIGQKRIDCSAAISIDMFNSLANKIKLLNEINGNGSVELNDGEKAYSLYGPMKMAALAKADLKEGYIFSLKNFSFKRTKEQTDLSQVDIINFIGKPLTKTISKNEVLNSSHFINIK